MRNRLTVGSNIVRATAGLAGLLACAYVSDAQARTSVTSPGSTYTLYLNSSVGLNHNCNSYLICSSTSWSTSDSTKLAFSNYRSKTSTLYPRAYGTASIRARACGWFGEYCFKLTRWGPRICIPLANIYGCSTSGWRTIYVRYPSSTMEVNVPSSKTVNLGTNSRMSVTTCRQRYWSGGGSRYGGGYAYRNCNYERWDPSSPSYGTWLDSRYRDDPRFNATRVGAQTFTFTGGYSGQYGTDTTRVTVPTPAAASHVTSRGTKTVRAPSSVTLDGDCYWSYYNVSRQRWENKACYRTYWYLNTGGLSGSDYVSATYGKNVTWRRDRTSTYQYTTFYAYDNPTYPTGLFTLQYYYSSYTSGYSRVVSNSSNIHITARPREFSSYSHGGAYSVQDGLTKTLSPSCGVRQWNTSSKRYETGACNYRWSLSTTAYGNFAGSSVSTTKNAVYTGTRPGTATLSLRVCATAQTSLCRTTSTTIRTDGRSTMTVSTTGAITVTDGSAFTFQGSCSQRYWNGSSYSNRACSLHRWYLNRYYLRYSSEEWVNGRTTYFYSRGSNARNYSAETAAWPTNGYPTQYRLRGYAPNYNSCPSGHECNTYSSWSNLRVNAKPTEVTTASANGAYSVEDGNTVQMVESCTARVWNANYSAYIGYNRGRYENETCDTNNTIWRLENTSYGYWNGQSTTRTDYTAHRPTFRSKLPGTVRVRVRPCKGSSCVWSGWTDINVTPQPNSMEVSASADVSVRHGENGTLASNQCRQRYWNTSTRQYTYRNCTSYRWYLNRYYFPDSSASTYLYLAGRSGSWTSSSNSTGITGNWPSNAYDLEYRVRGYAVDGQNAYSSYRNLRVLPKTPYISTISAGAPYSVVDGSRVQLSSTCYPYEWNTATGYRYASWNMYKGDYTRRTCSSTTWSLSTATYGSLDSTTASRPWFNANTGRPGSLTTTVRGCYGAVCDTSAATTITVTPAGDSWTLTGGPNVTVTDGQNANLTAANCYRRTWGGTSYVNQPCTRYRFYLNRYYHYSTASPRGYFLQNRTSAWTLYPPSPTTSFTSVEPTNFPTSFYTVQYYFRGYVGSASSVSTDRPTLTIVPKASWVSTIDAGSNRSVVDGSTTNPSGEACSYTYWYGTTASNAYYRTANCAWNWTSSNTNVVTVSSATNSNTPLVGRAPGVATVTLRGCVPNTTTCTTDTMQVAVTPRASTFNVSAGSTYTAVDQTPVQLSGTCTYTYWNIATANYKTDPCTSFAWRLSTTTYGNLSNTNLLTPSYLFDYGTPQTLYVYLRGSYGTTVGPEARATINGVLAPHNVRIDAGSDKSVAVASSVAITNNSCRFYRNRGTYYSTYSCQTHAWSSSPANRVSFNNAATYRPTLTGATFGTGTLTYRGCYVYSGTTYCQNDTAALNVTAPPLPVAISGPYTTGEGTSRSVSGTCSGCPNGTTYAWQFDNDAAAEATALTATFDPRTLEIDGGSTATRRNISLTACFIGRCETANSYVDVTNENPTVDTLPTITFAPYTAGTLDINGADPAGPTLDPLTWSWVENTASLSLARVDDDTARVSTTGLVPGTYYWRLRASDGDGGTGTSNRAVLTISPLTLSAGGPYTVGEGATGPVAATCAQCPANTVYKWNFDNDSSYDDATGRTSTFNRTTIDGSASGTRQNIAVQACVGSYCQTASSYVTITNRAPSITTCPSNATAVAGQQYDATIVGSDPAGSSRDPLTFRYTVQPSGMSLVNADATSVTARWSSPLPGTSNVSVVANDGDGGDSSTCSWSIAVADLNVSIAGPSSVNEGGFINVLAQCSNCPASGVTYAWDLNDNGGYNEGTAAANTFRPGSFGYDSGTNRTLRVRVTVNGYTKTVAKTVSVNNLAPSFTSPNPSRSATVFSLYSTTLTASDPAGVTLDPLTFSRQSPTANNVTVTKLNSTQVVVSFTPTSPGNFPIKIRVTDDEGAFGEYEWTVAASYPPADASGGPDLSGYRWTRYPYVATRSMTGATSVTLADDALSGWINLPFPMNYYGRQYSRYKISSNGFISFVGNSAGSPGQRFPATTSTNGTIGGCWAELNPASGGTIRYRSIGSGAGAEHVIEFGGVHHKNTTSSTYRASFQIVLKPDSTFEIQNINCRPFGGLGASVGFENDRGNVGTDLYFDTAGTGSQNRHWVVTPPTIQPNGGAHSFAEAARIDVNGTCLPTCSATGRTYGWDWDNNGTLNATGINATYAANGIDGGSSPTVRNVRFGYCDNTNCVWDPTTISVSNVAPTIAAIPNSTGNVGQLWTYNITVTDPAPVAWDPRNLSLSGEPSGMTLSGNQIRWTPTNPGAVTVTVDVNDGDGGTDTETFTLSISEQGGPDYPGYRWSGVNSAWSWTDIRSTGSAISLGNDSYAQVSLPQPFGFYGKSYSRVYVSSNGFLTFEAPPDNGRTSARMPSTTGVNGVIAGWWADLRPDASGAEVDYQTIGNQFIVQWSNVPAASLSASSRSTFQIALDLTSYDATIRCLDCNPDGSRNFSMGFENNRGDFGLSIRYGALSASQVAWRMDAPSVHTNIGGLHAVNEGTTRALSTSANPPTCVRCTSTTWDMDNDGVFETSGLAPNFTATDGPRSRTVVMRSCVGAICNNDRWIINDQNVAPTINAIPGQNASVGNAWSYTAVAQDVPGDMAGIRWSLVQGRGSLGINSTSGVMTWTPGALDAGLHSIVIRADDQEGGVRDRSFTINVGVDVTGGGPYTVDEGSTVQVAGTCGGNACTTWSWDFDNDGAFDDATGQVAQYPGLDGAATVQIRVQGCRGSTCDSGTATVNVRNTNPRITTSAPTRVAIGGNYLYNPVGEDDAGALDPLTWTRESGPAWLNFSAAIPRLSGTPTQGGRYPVEIKVADDDGGESTESWTIIVNVSANAGGPYTVPEGSTVNLSASCNGCDGDKYRWDFDGDTQFDDATGPTPTFVATTIDGSVSRTVTLRVCEGNDGQNCATSAATINVENVAPTITSTPILIASIGTTYTYDVDATDPIDPITYRFDGSVPNGMSVNGTSGVITWAGNQIVAGRHLIKVRAVDDEGAYDEQTFTIAVVGVNPNATGAAYVVDEGGSLTLTASCVACTRFQWDIDNNGSWDVNNASATFTAGDGDSTPTVRVRACDGSDESNCAIASATVQVNNVPPVITTTPVLTAQVAVAYSYDADANDPPDANELRWSFVGTQPAGMQIDAQSGRISWTPATGGTFDVTIRVDDQDGGTADQTFRINVQVTVALGGTFTVNEGSSRNLTATTNGGTRIEWDLDNDSAFEAEGPGVTFNAIDGDAVAPISARACSEPGARISVDGDLSDWNLPVFQVGESNGIQYYLTYDDDYVYVVWQGVILANDKVFVAFDQDPQPSNNGSSGQFGGATFNGSRRPEYAIVFDDRNQIFYAPHNGSGGWAGGQNVSTWFHYAGHAVNRTSELRIPRNYLGSLDFDAGFGLWMWVNNNAESTVWSAVPTANGTGNSPRNLASANVWTTCSGTANIAVATRNMTIDNVAPTITSNAITTANLGQSYSYTAAATDPGVNDILTWSRVTGPTGLSVSNGGVVSWATAVAGVHPVQIRVSDGDDAVTQSFDIVVISASPGGPYTVDEGSSVTLTGGCNACGDFTPTFSWDLDSNGSFETNTRNPSFDASAIDGPANRTVVLRVCDQADATNCHTASANIAIRNVAPIITSTPVTIGVLNTLYDYPATATDPGPETLVWSLPTAPTGMTVAANGRVTWPAGQVVAGRHAIRLAVTDGTDTATQDFTVVVVSVNADEAGSGYQIGEGLTVRLNPSCVACTRFYWDLDGNTTNGSAGFEFDGEQPNFLGADGPSTPAVRVRACDGNSLDNCAIATINVTVDNRPPEFTSTPSSVGQIGVVYDYEAQVSDPASDGDTPMAFVLDVNPAGMTINGNTGRVRWGTPVAGVHPVRVRATDEDGGSAIQNWQITVVGIDAGGPYVVNEGSNVTLVGACTACDVATLSWDLDGDGLFEVTSANAVFASSDGPDDTRAVTLRGCAPGNNCATANVTVTVNNVAPVISSAPVTEGVVNTNYRYAAVATDPGDDTLTWSLVTPPTGMQINATGVITWLPNIPGTYQVHVRVTDSDGAIGNQIFTLIIPVNVASGGPYQVDEGSTVVLTANCVSCSRYQWDLDNDGTFDTNQNPYTWAGVDGRRVFNVTVKGCETADESNCDQTSTTVTVLNVAPVITSSPVLTGALGVDYTYDVNATDAAGSNDTITYSLQSGGPAWLSIVGTTGVITGRPLEGGTHSITVVASDEDNGSSTQTYDLVIPVAVAFDAPSYTVAEGSAVTITASCNGCDRIEWDLDLDASYDDATTAAVTYNAVDGPATFNGTTPAIRVRVCEGTGGETDNCATAAPTITVNNVAPTIDTTPQNNASVGNQWVYAATATDPGDDTIAWSLVGQPSGMAVNASGRVTWTPAAGGTVQFNLRVTDSDGSFTEQQITLTVDLVVSAGGPYVINEGGTISLVGTCDGCAVFEWDLDNDGAFDDANTAATSLAALDGPATPTVRMRGCENATRALCTIATPQITINNVAPSFDNTPSTIGRIGTAYAFVAQVSDPAGAADAPLVIALAEGPTGLALNGSTVSWPAPAAGRHTVALTVTDDDNAATRLEWTINVVGVDIGGPYTVNEGSPVTLQASCTACTRFAWDLDDDGQFDDGTNAQVTFASVDGPATPAIHVRVCDGATADNCVVDDGTVTVNNVAPTFTTTNPTTTGAIGTGYSFDFNASDPGDDTIAFSLASGPAWLTIVGATGVATGTPVAGGTFAVTVRVTDSDNASTDLDYEIVVAPRVTFDAATYNVAEGTTQQIQASATCTGCNRFEWDLDGDGQYDDATGTTVNFLAPDGPSSPVITLRVCQGATNCVTASPDIDVFNVAPTFTSSPVLTGALGVQYTYDSDASDVAGDTITYSVQAGPTGMTIDSDGIVTWATPIAGRHTVTLAARDDDNATGTQTFEIAVVGVGVGGPYTVPEGGAIDLVATCTACTRLEWDLDGDNQYDDLTTNGQTSTARFTNTIDGPATPTVRVRACDGAGTTNCIGGQPSVTVENVAPTINSTAVTAGALGVAYRYQVTASDPGVNDTFTWSLTQRPNTNMTINAAGLITWTPDEGGTHQIVVQVRDNDGANGTQTFDLVIPVGVAFDRASYDVNEGSSVTIVATCNGCARFEWDLDNDSQFDDASGAQVSFAGLDGPATPTITVRACEGTSGSTNCTNASPVISVVNLPPVITSRPTAAIAVGSTFTYQATASDAAGLLDTQNFVWSLATAPTGMTVVASTGVVTWPSAAAGAHSVRLEVADGDGGTGVQEFTLQVVGANIGGPYAVDEGGSVQMNATCQSCVTFVWDFDNDGQYDDGNGPTATFVAGTRDGPTTAPISVQVCDAGGICAAANANVTVNNVAPRITTSPALKAELGQVYRYTALGTDPIDTITWSLISGPSSMAIGGTNGVLTWTAVAGTHSVVIQADDGDGGRTTQSWQIEVVGAEAGGPYAVDEFGGNVQLSGTCVGCVRFEWDLDGNGSVDSTVNNPQFNASAIDGTVQRTVTLRSCDNDGFCASDTAIININNVAPTITTSPTTAGMAGSVWTYTVMATDPAGAADPLVFSLVSGPTGMTFDANKAEFAWSAVPGQHAVTIQVDDGDGGITRQEFTIVVPSPIDVEILGGPFSLNEGSSITLEAECAPACVSFEWDFDGDGMYDDANGETPAFSAADIDGDRAVTVAVRGCSSQNFCSVGSARIDVLNVAPTITTSPALTTTNGGSYVYDADATDPAGLTADPLSWRLVTGPGGMTIGTQDGVVRWTGTPGLHDVTIEVDDGDNNGTRQQRWQIAVTPEITVATVTPRGQPERADYAFQSTVSVDWSLSLFRRDGAGNCTTDLLHQRTVNGADRMNGTWSALTPNRQYCWSVEASASGAVTRRQDTFAIDGLTTFVAGPTATRVGLDVRLDAEVSRVGAGTVQYSEGNCATSQTALRFGGSNIATFPGTIVPADEFTLEAWINLAGASQTRKILDSRNGGAVLELNAGNLQLSVQTAGMQRLTSPQAVPVGSYSHIVASFSANNRMRLFLNGVPAGEQLVTGANMIATTPTMVLGALGGQGFIGEIASLAVYRRELTPTEIQTHFNAGSATELARESDRVAAWHFSEAPTVQSIYDADALGYAGVLGGAFSTEASDPTRRPVFASSAAMGNDTDLTTTLTGLTGGPAYCYRVVVATANDVIATAPDTFIRVTDTEAPVISPDPIFVAECAGNSERSVTLALPSVSDNVDPDPSIEALVNNMVITFPFDFQLGDTNVVWRATDDSGNVGTAIQVVTIRDTTNPDVTGGSELIANATSPNGTVVNAVPASATDSCSAVTITNDHPQPYPLGPTTVTFTVTDASGRATQATRVIRVVDTEAPRFDPPLSTLRLSHDGTACFTLTPPNPSVSDNAYAASAITIVGQRLNGPGNPNCWDLGTHDVRWTITDPSNNSRQGVQVIEIVESTLAINVVGLEVSGRTAQTGRFYNAPVTLIFSVSEGVSPYAVTLDPAPANVTSSGNTFRATYRAEGDYGTILIRARDESGTGINFGTVAVTGFGIDLTPPTIEADLVDQSGVLIGNSGTYPYVFLGETIPLDRIRARDAQLELTTLQSALRFDGGDLVVVPRPSSGFFGAAAADNVTVEAWVRSSRVGAFTAVSKAAGDGSGSTIELGVRNDGLATISMLVGGLMRTVVGGSVTSGDWTHLAATYDGRSIRLYVNGRPANHVYTTGNVVVGTGPFVLGGTFVNGVPASRFEGSMAGVAIWRTALDMDTIQDHFRGGLATRIAPTPDTVALYHFDGTGQRVDDATTNVNHGQLGTDANVGDDDPVRATLAHAPAPTASGIANLRVRLTKTIGTDASPMINRTVALSGTPLARGWRGIGALPCDAPVGSVCRSGEDVLTADMIAIWDANQLGAYHIEIVATDAAGNESVLRVGLRLQSYVGALGEALIAIQAMRDELRNRGSENELGTAHNDVTTAQFYATMPRRYMDGSFLRTDNAIQFLDEAQTVGVDTGRTREYLSRSLAGSVRRYVDALQVPVEDRHMAADANRYLMDAEFDRAARDWHQQATVGRSADRAVALLYAPYQSVRTRQRAARLRFEQTLSLLGTGQMLAEDVRTDALRVIQVQQLMATTRDMLRDVVYAEISAVLDTTLTTERQSLETILDVLDKASSSADESGDLIAISDPNLRTACLDRLATLSLDDEEFTHCYLRLGDMAQALDGVSEPLVETYRFRAGVGTALFSMLELSMYISPSGLPFVANGGVPPTTSVVLPDSRAALVPNSIAASTVDRPDGFLQRSWARHQEAFDALASAQVDEAWAVFIDERCLLLEMYNRYYSTLNMSPNVADPREQPIDPLTVRCPSAQN